MAGTNAAKEMSGLGTHGDESSGSAFTRTEGRRFGLAVGAAFLALALLSGWRHTWGAPLGPRLLAILGALLVIGGAAAPARLELPYRGWMAFATALSRVTGPVSLGVVYFLAILPTGLLARLFRHAPLATQPGETYWVRREAGAGHDLHRQF